MRYLYHLDWNEPSLYDVVLNTERLSMGRAVAVLREMLADEQFASTESSRQQLRDRSLAALARAALLANATTRSTHIGVTAARSEVELTGLVMSEQERQAAEAAVARIAGVGRVRNELVVRAGPVDDLGHGQFRHGAERSWGGYGEQPDERDRRR